MTPDRIVDAHHHLWDLEAVYYPWLMARGEKRFFGDPAPIQKNYLPTDFTQDIGPLPVVKSVHIQVGAESAADENDWLTRIAANGPYPSALVTFCDLTTPELERDLDRLSTSPYLRGIRQIVGRSAEEDARTGTNSLLQNARFRAGLTTLAARGLSFDLQLTPPQMAAAASVIEAIPDLKVAICHGGSPSDFTQEGLEAWKEGLRRLARHPRTICKLSGFGMFRHDWTIDHIRQLILPVIDIFSPERVAFGSNFPVDRLYATYDRVWAAYGEVTKGFSASEIDAMFAGTAETFYGM